MTTPRTEAVRRLGSFIEKVTEGMSAADAIGLEDDLFAQDIETLLRAEAAAPDVEALDVGRLARALHANANRAVNWERCANQRGHEEEAAALAAEYARLLKDSGEPR